MNLLIFFGFLKFENRKKGKADPVYRFKNDPSIAVFMLNSRNQSSGLTLVAASHVILVEPLLYHGVEAQAISRIHRIGQSQITFVYRYLIKNSIEQAIFALRMSREGHEESSERQMGKKELYGIGKDNKDLSKIRPDGEVIEAHDLIEFFKKS